MTLLSGAGRLRCYKATVNESETITAAKPPCCELQAFGFTFPAAPHLERS
jgi:hypothetical protein